MRVPVNDRNAVSETVPLIEIVPGGTGALDVTCTLAVGEGDTGDDRAPSHAANEMPAIAIKSGAGMVRMCEAGYSRSSFKFGNSQDTHNVQEMVRGHPIGPFAPDLAVWRAGAELAPLERDDSLVVIVEDPA